MYVQLIKDVALLVALTSLHSLLTRLRATGRIWPQLLSGLLFGAVAVAGMAVPFQYQPGIIYDGRSIVLALSGLFGGWITGLVSVVVAGAYRAVLGGVGIWAGLASIVVPRSLASCSAGRAGTGRTGSASFPSTAWASPPTFSCWPASSSFPGPGASR